MMGAYVSIDPGNGYPSNYSSYDAYFLANCQKSGNLYSNISTTPFFIKRPYSHGNSVKLCHMLSMIPMVQRPCTVDFGYYKELSCCTRICEVWCSFSVIYNDDPMKLPLAWGSLRLTLLASFALQSPFHKVMVTLSFG